ncbi:DNA-binding transcription factor yap1 [Dispira parvispora]|uniref:DNA-binding transcription factor yap1 n=1 Tax=Dispira parvispora TaxID=1520584 RepID=A0A9W8AMA8_9FUNG|nr:DNA-binding transcription factor yap1 [Dispira parvispora]
MVTETERSSPHADTKRKSVHGTLSLGGPPTKFTHGQEPLQANRFVPQSSADPQENNAKEMSPTLTGSTETSNGKTKKPGRKMLTTEAVSKRTAQNRAAQRAFRERKQRYTEELEKRLKELEERTLQSEKERQELAALVEQLRNENLTLKAASFTFSMPLSTPTATTKGNDSTVTPDLNTFLNHYPTSLPGLTFSNDFPAVPSTVTDTAGTLSLTSDANPMDINAAMHHSLSALLPGSQPATTTTFPVDTNEYSLTNTFFAEYNDLSNLGVDESTFFDLNAPATTLSTSTANEVSASLSSTTTAAIAEPNLDTLHTPLVTDNHPASLVSTTTDRVDSTPHSAAASTATEINTDLLFSTTGEMDPLANMLTPLAGMPLADMYDFSSVIALPLQTTDIPNPISPTAHNLQSLTPPSTTTSDSMSNVNTTTTGNSGVALDPNSGKHSTDAVADTPTTFSISQFGPTSYTTPPFSGEPVDNGNPFSWSRSASSTLSPESLKIPYSSPQTLSSLDSPNGTTPPYHPTGSTSQTSLYKPTSEGPLTPRSALVLLDESEYICRSATRLEDSELDELCRELEVHAKCSEYRKLKKLMETGNSQ